MRPIAFALLFLPCFTFAQQDSTVPSDKELRRIEWAERHSPGRAALYSAILPGAGQVYNRKYWKVPIVAAGLGISYYFIRDNNEQYTRYRDAYLAVIDGDPNTTDPFNGQYSSPSLLKLSDTYRRWRDQSYIALGLIYVLNVMDAAVDGYFVRFDVSDDLSLRLAPAPSLLGYQAAGFSLSLHL